MEWIPVLALPLISFLACALAARIGLRAAGARQLDLTLHWTERARETYPARVLIVPLAIFLPLIAGYATLFVNVGRGSALPGPAIASLSAVAAYVATIWAGRYWMPPMPGAPKGLRGAVLSQVAALFLLMPQTLIIPAWVIILAVIPSAGPGGFEQIAALAGVTFLLQQRPFWMLKPAPAELTARIDEIARRAGIPPIRVFALPLRQANAYAWVRWQAVGFTEPVLASLSVEELIAVAAHELGHLAEPPRAKKIRLVSAWFLPALLATSVLGIRHMIPITTWFFGAGFACMFFSRAIRGFSRRMETAADAFAERTVHGVSAEGAAIYGRALERIYELNLAPVVMGAKGRSMKSHPDLYDRLINLKLTPAYPRPEPPSRNRMRRGSRLAVATAAAALALPIAWLRMPARSGSLPSALARAALTGRCASELSGRAPASIGTASLREALDRCERRENHH